MKYADHVRAVEEYLKLTRCPASQKEKEYSVIHLNQGDGLLCSTRVNLPNTTTNKTEVTCRWCVRRIEKGYDTL